MKKIIALIALLGAATAFADTFGSDSYLYWMIDNTGSFEWTTARASIGGGDYLTIAREGVISGTKSMTKADATSDFFYNWAALAGYESAQSMVIELYNGSEFVAESDALLLSDAAQYIVNNRMGTGLASVATFGNFHIPEPNSAMLMLVGAALLGLKRKRAKKA